MTGLFCVRRMAQSSSKNLSVPYPSRQEETWTKNSIVSMGLKGRAPLYRQPGTDYLLLLAWREAGRDLLVFTNQRGPELPLSDAAVRRACALLERVESPLQRMSRHPPYFHRAAHSFLFLSFIRSMSPRLRAPPREPATRPRPHRPVSRVPPLRGQASCDIPIAARFLYSFFRSCLFAGMRIAGRDSKYSLPCLAAKAAAAVSCRWTWRPRFPAFPALWSLPRRASPYAGRGCPQDAVQTSVGSICMLIPPHPLPPPLPPPPVFQCAPAPASVTYPSISALKRKIVNRRFMESWFSVSLPLKRENCHESGLF